MDHELPEAGEGQEAPDLMDLSDQELSHRLTYFLLVGLFNFQKIR